LHDEQTITITVTEDSILNAGPMADDGGADEFRLVRNGAELEGYLNGALVFVRVFDEVSNLAIVGSTDDDTLIVDLSGGAAVPETGIEFTGGGPADNDTLVLTGGGAESIVYTPFDAHSGTVSLDGRLITYSELEPVIDDVDAEERVFVFGSGADAIAVSVGESRTTLTSPSSESVDFANPTGTLTIRAGEGDDTIVVTGSPADFELLIDAGGGDDTVISEFPVASVVTGTNAADRIEIEESAGVLTIEVNEAVSTLSGVSRLKINALDGDDQVTLRDITVDVSVDAGAGDDVVNGSDVRVVGLTLIGNAGDDRLYGGDGADTLLGGPGRDVLIGNDGDDLLAGGDGNDRIYGGDGDDVLIGGAGYDRLRGGPGHDTLIRGSAQIADWSLNETSGSRIADSAGTAQDGIFFGPESDLGEPGPPSVRVPYGAGTAANLHGRTEQYIAVAHDSAFAVAEGTIRFWFNARDAVERQTLLAKDQRGERNGLRISLNDHNIQVRLESGNATYVLDTQATSFGGLITPNTWYELTFTFGANGMRLYVDGVLVAANDYSGGLLGNRAAIVMGGSNHRNRSWLRDLSRLTIDDPFDGLIDEVAFYGAALTPQQISVIRELS
ncbi:MAG TPA: LamG-like jellyroll fold domain-containing protein, partial [Gammaproteobacteria bacterium]|nr:LamG-like jellyroll fold domain-containing protein [Gammaproteobacteria bacterium]